jgi:hypothetical protein
MFVAIGFSPKFSPSGAVIGRKSWQLSPRWGCTKLILSFLQTLSPRRGFQSIDFQRVILWVINRVQNLPGVSGNENEVLG